jgi:hypothetical protein
MFGRRYGVAREGLEKVEKDRVLGEQVNHIDADRTVKVSSSGRIVGGCRVAANITPRADILNPVEYA